MIILFALQSFLVKDDVKYRTFYTIKNSLIILAMLGDYDEKFLALSLLFFFSFDEVLSEKLRESTNLLINLEQNVLQADQLDESIYILTVCLKNILHKKELLSDYKSRVDKESKKPTKSRLSPFEKKLLLTNHDSNELICMRIKLELEKRGFVETGLIKRVKIVSNNSSGLCGSILGMSAPASAKNKIDIDNIMRLIEQCDQLIVCMSSLFEFSEICQFEVFYARLLGKRIVPIIIQNEYVPDYWLEDLCEDLRPVKVGLNSIKIDILKLIDEVGAERNQESSDVYVQAASVMAKAATSGPKSASQQQL
jgi:hypothetical protein